MPTLATTNFTLPSGATDHGQPNLICRPADWFTVLSFFLGNYISHAMTMQVFPGESPLRQLLAFATVLLFPGAGISRALNNIARGILVTMNWRESDLQRAAAAGALCMIVRTDGWTPKEEQLHLDSNLAPSTSFKPTWKIFNPEWMQTPRFIHGWSFVDAIPTHLIPAFASLRHIQGASQPLPPGYAYAPVPPHALVTTLANQPKIHIPKSLNSARLVLTIIQTIYAIYTLYQSRGDQIQRYGYAAFSLTVAPYAVMSVVNLLGSLLMPGYPTLFLVRSEVMNELEERYGKWFDGVVGTLLASDPEADTDKQAAVNINECSQSPSSPTNGSISIPSCGSFQRTGASRPAVQLLQANRGLFPDIWLHVTLSAFIAIGIPLAIIGGLSGVEEGASTRAQRVWTMTWLGMGGVYGLGFSLRLCDAVPSRKADVWKRAVLATPAIGGMVVVAKMVIDYGDCLVF